MSSDNQTKQKRKPSSFSKFEKICESYGAKVNIGEFYVEISFKDNKSLRYARYYGSKLNKILEDIEKNGIHGRVFKDGKLIGYAPEKMPLENILIAVDLIV